MKASLVTVALVAVASSLVTAGTIELLRSARPGPRSAASAESTRRDPASASTRPRAGSSTDLRPPEGPVAADRLDELERRVAALELAATSIRTPLSGPTPAAGELPPGNELRDLVLDWVAEEREARRRAAELREEQHALEEQEFDSRYRAHMMAQEYDLEPWQEDELTRVFLEVETRRREIEREIDVHEDDPAEVEERWAAFDRWADQRERETAARLDPAFYEDLYGEDQD